MTGVQELDDQAQESVPTGDHDDGYKTTLSSTNQSLAPWAPVQTALLGELIDDVPNL